MSGTEFLYVEQPALDQLQKSGWSYTDGREFAPDKSNVRLSFKELVLGLKVREISDVIHTYENELVVFMICDRRKMDADIPSLEKLKEAEFNKLYSVLSLRYLMRLRRTASIELKIR